MTLSGADGQLRGFGWHGFYQDGIRVLARLEVLVGGLEPVPLHSASVSAAEARFLGALPIPGDPAPDPGLLVERLRHASGRERITLRNTGTRAARLPLELMLGSDLGPLGPIGAGLRTPDLPARVHAAGLRWSVGRHGHVGGAEASAAVPTMSVTAATAVAAPTPHAVLAPSGTLRWDLELRPGAAWSAEITVTLEGGTADSGRPPRTPPEGPGAVPSHERERGAVAPPWSAPTARCDDARLPALLDRALDELRALLLTDPEHPGDRYPASGAPWRFGLVPVDALRAARMLLPLGTDLAEGTLRALARRQLRSPGPACGLIPGPVRQAGPGLPPAGTAVEATLLLVTVLAEAWRWGLPEDRVVPLLPAVERALACLESLTAADGLVAECLPPAGAPRQTAGPGGPAGREAAGPEAAGREVSGPGGAGREAAEPGPAWSPFRAATQAAAHRAALHGAELLDAFGRPGGERHRERAARLRERFRSAFWTDDPSGGVPAAALTAERVPLPGLGSELAHLLDPGLSERGSELPGLLADADARTLARRLAGPDVAAGWGLRTLTARSPRFSPLGHRSGAVRSYETALAVNGLAALGLEREAADLLGGLLDAADSFGGVLPEMFGGEQRPAGGRPGGPAPHPGACRSSATAAASAVGLVAALAGVRPDVPGGRVAVRPMSTAPLGELELTGLRVAGRPFAVRISRIGVAVVEEAAEGLQLGT